MGPRVDSLSNHRVTPGQIIWAYGAGFTGVARVTVGDSAATDLINYDDVTLGFTVPKQPGGSANWVQVTGADGSTSPCIGEGQLLTYLDEVIDPPRGKLELDSVTPPSGGTLTVHGGALSGVLSVAVGNVEATIDELHDDHIVVTVGSLAEYAYTEVPVVAITEHAGTPTNDLTKLRVRAAEPAQDA
jgi:hypothetical protein